MIHYIKKYWVEILSVITSAVTIMLLINIYFVLDEKNMQVTTKEEQVQQHSEEEIDAPNESPYQNLYEDLYVSPPTEEILESKMVYLTFDDGPSKRTLEILDILDKHNVKATFFVTVQEEKEDTKEIMKQVVDRGHSIGIHTYSHDYKKIYSSVENYLDDFNKISEYIFEATGVKSNIFRFPGGSVNSYNKGTYKEIISEMSRRGYVYYDWNACSDDAISAPSSNVIYKNSIRNMENLDRVILLFHDSLDRKTTVEALGDVITEFKNKGYEFSRITNDVKPITMPYRK